MSRRRIQAAAAVTVAVLAVAGCTSSDGDGDGGRPAKVGEGVRSGPAGSIPVIAEQKDLPTVDVAGSFTPGDSLTIGIRSLKVDPNGRTMTLRLVFTPKLASKSDANAKVRLYDLFVGGGGGNFDPSLLDRANLKKYNVIRSVGAQPLASDLNTGGPNNNSFEAWAVYAAPQDPVSTLEVSVKDLWPVFTDVPVTR